MILVIVTACSILTSSKPPCREFHFTFAEDITATQCIMGVQQNIAYDWVTRHPNWIMNRITCREKKPLNGNEEADAKEDI